MSLRHSRSSLPSLVTSSIFATSIQPFLRHVLLLSREYIRPQHPFHNEILSRLHSFVPRLTRAFPMMYLLLNVTDLQYKKGKQTLTHHKLTKPVKHNFLTVRPINLNLLEACTPTKGRNSCQPPHFVLSG